MSKRLEKVLNHLAAERCSSTTNSQSQRKEETEEEYEFETSPYLEGYYKPVSTEISSENLQVTSGSLPTDLDGYYVRNGPNAFFDFTHKPYHIFDGDGMLHSIRIRNGKADYSNRWVQTKRLQKDKERGFSFAENGEYAVGKLDNMKYIFDENGKRMGKANTSIIVHSKKVLALDEQDAPYQVKLPNLETVGKYDFNGKLRHYVTAHPKIDPISGEMFFFCYYLRKRAPWLMFSAADKNGEITKTFPVAIRNSTMIHDCAITENYVIILDMPLVFDMDRVSEGQSPWFFDSSKPSLFGLLPRNSKDGKDVRWFQFSSCYIYHIYNAWEENGKVHLVACRNEVSFMDLKPEDSEKNIIFTQEYIFDLETGLGSEQRLHPIPGDFPVVNQQLTGRKNRFFYHVSPSLRSTTEITPFKTVVKYDKELNRCYLHTLEDGMVSGEFVFVPKKDATEEDDGYLISFCHNETTDHSEFYVIDAKTMNEKPLARVKLPQRVPFGFHGSWFKREEVEA